MDARPPFGAAFLWLLWQHETALLSVLYCLSEKIVAAARIGAADSAAGRQYAQGA